MPTNQQRRDAERRRLQQQLEERRQREIARRRFTLIGSIVGTLVIIAAIVVVIVVVNSDSDTSSTASKGTGTATSSAGAATTPSPSSSAATSAAPALPAAACTTLKGTSVSFHGVKVSGATDLKHAPKVTSTATAGPATLECADVVVGTGKAATPSSTVSVQYSGVLYRNGTAFDSSWSRGGKPASFSLTGVVPGFTQGIGGAGKAGPMHVGGRRIMILPASLGYGSQATGSIPANSPLVFVVDLVSVS